MLFTAQVRPGAAENVGFEIIVSAARLPLSFGW